MHLRYIPKFGTLEIKVDGHRHVLHRAGVNEEGVNDLKEIMKDGVGTGAFIKTPIVKYSGSSISGETQLVKDVFAAVSDLPLRDGEPVSFDTDQCLVDIKKRGAVRHDADMSKESAEVQAFHAAIHSYDAGRFTEIQQLEELRDAPVVYQTKTIKVESIQIVDGTPTVVMVTKEVIDTELKEIMKNGVGIGGFIKIPIVKTAAILVSMKDKDRLEALKTADIN